MSNLTGNDTLQELEKRLRAGDPRAWGQLRQQSTHYRIEQDLRLRTPTIRLNKQEHGAFLGWVEEMAAKVGIPHTPAVFVVDHIPGVPIAYRKLPNAAGIGGPINLMALNPTIMEGTQSSLYRTPSTKMQGILAHELSHVRHDFGSSMATGLGPLIAPLAGLIGLWMYDRAQQKRQSNKEPTSPQEVKQLNQDINAAAEEEKKHVDEQIYEPGKWHIDPVWQKAAIDVGRCMMVAAVSYAGAMLLARPSSISREYAADRFAVELTGEPETFKQTLTEIHKMADEMKKSVPPPSTFKEHVERIHKKFKNLTNHAHPTLKQRIAAIDKLTKAETHVERLGLESFTNHVIR